MKFSVQVFLCKNPTIVGDKFIRLWSHRRRWNDKFSSSFPNVSFLPSNSNSFFASNRRRNNFRRFVEHLEHIIPRVCHRHSSRSSLNRFRRRFERFAQRRAWSLWEFYRRTLFLLHVDNIRRRQWNRWTNSTFGIAEFHHRSRFNLLHICSAGYV